MEISDDLVPVDKIKDVHHGGLGAMRRHRLATIDPVVPGSVRSAVGLHAPVAAQFHQ